MIRTISYAKEPLAKPPRMKMLEPKVLKSGLKVKLILVA
jgi:hypothetical protein